MAESLLNSLEQIGTLKPICRTGWVDWIPEPPDHKSTAWAVLIKSSAHNVESKKDGSIGNDTRIKNQSSGRHKEGRASKSTERTEDTGEATQEKETEVDQAEVNDERL